MVAVGVAAGLVLAGCRSGGGSPDGVATSATRGGAPGATSGMAGTPGAAASPQQGVPPEAPPSPAVVEHARTVPALHRSVDDYPRARVELTSPDGRLVHRLAVLWADTPARRRHGLMEVPHLPEGTGMVFTFPGGSRGGFWMKGTLVPLAVAFVDDGRIGTILGMSPCPQPPPGSPCPVYDPGHPYTVALEVPRGWFAAQGVQPGWGLEILTGPTPAG